MAFLAEKISLKKNETAVCPVCKRTFKRGMKLKSPYKCATADMCEECFKLCYKNTQQNRTAAVIDDTMNVSTQRRNADILENTGADGGKEPEGGFEYVYPNMTAYDLSRELKSWIFIFVILKLTFYILFGRTAETDTVSFGTVIFNSMLAFVSGILFFHTLVRAVNGTHRGIAKSRKTRLFLMAAVYVVLLCFSLMSIINYTQS